VPLPLLALPVIRVVARTIIIAATVKGMSNAVEVIKRAKDAENRKKIWMNFRNAKNNIKLNIMLTRTTKQLGIPAPWGKNRSLDDFMNDPNAVLRF